MLTDGAAAQYGTDAVAGVVNIITKKNSSGGVISGTAGQYYNGEGGTSDLTANIGLPLLGSKGYINITGNQQTHDFTRVGGADPRYINAQGQPVPVGTVGAAPNAQGIIACSGGNCIPTSGPSAVTGNFNYPNVNLIAGDGEYQLVQGAVQAGVNITDDIELYFEGTIAERTAKSHQNDRLPTQIIASPGSNQPCSATNPQGYNTAQTATGGAACAFGAVAGTVGVAPIQGSVANPVSGNAFTGLNSKGIVISSGQAGTLFTPGELVQYPTGHGAGRRPAGSGLSVQYRPEVQAPGLRL